MAIDKPLYRHETVIFDVVTRAEYDVNYLTDRLVVEVFGGNRKGYSAIRVEIDSEQDFLDRIDEFGPEMRRRSIDAALELGFAAGIEMRDRQIDDLKTLVAHLRRPLWRKVYDKVASWIEGLK